MDLESVLAKSGVHMRDKDDVIRKVSAIARDGPEKLLVSVSGWSLYVIMQRA